VGEEDDARFGSPLCILPAPSFLQEEKSAVDDTRMSSHLITLSEDKERGELRRNKEEGDNVLHMTDGSQCQYDTPVKVSKDLWRVKNTMCNGRELVDHIEGSEEYRAIMAIFSKTKSGSGGKSSV
jgi:hypothetical protein